jgi:hypothetical protein
MTGLNYRRIFIMVGAILLAALLVGDVPITADDETSTDASAEVLPAGGISYGYRVTGFRNVLFPNWTLGEPDDRGAFLFWRGWLSVELEDTIANADMISIWAANSGWWSTNIKIYVSADGSKWKRIGIEKVKSARFLKYDINGNFGDVCYIKMERSGGRWSLLRIDAVGAKGGD